MNKRYVIFCGFAFSMLLMLVSCNIKSDEQEQDVSASANSESMEENVEKREKQEEVEKEEGQKERGEENEDTGLDSEQDPSLGDFDVYIGGEMIEAEDKIIIHGESNLLPDSRVMGEVSVGEDEYFADTVEVVQDDGTFYMEIDHHHLDEETAVVVTFSFEDMQEDKIKRHYGDRGQKLEGPYIYKHSSGGKSQKSIYNQAKVLTSFMPGEEKVVRHFKEPDWYPIPDDMEDPRVWIEVEDVKDDKEFYYIHGRSNLMEGSLITGGFNSVTEEEAMIQPDGSFDLRVEYGTPWEDQPFTIQFRPFNQWNIVEEVYGKKGQNLVGELVETDGGADNKYQYIEKTVEIHSAEIDLPENVEVEIDGPEVTMLIPDHVLFDFDEYNLKKDSKKILEEISETIASIDHDLEVEIKGHTDDVGKENYNMELSEKRAEEVKIFLSDYIDSKGIQFITEGYGDTQPIASNDTESGQEKNRRVEIVINLQK
ncbi:MAG TPA: OmpA family protein [Bacillota bacterium]|nr:OmpA family protein [Bacillota bacterium]